jgi:hypothetical protein
MRNTMLKIFRRVYSEEDGQKRNIEEFSCERSMASSRLLPISSNYPGGWIYIKEYENENLLRVYEYFNPTDSKIINFNSKEDIVSYNNGLRINGWVFNFIQSMKMAVILGEEVPHSVVHRAIFLFHPDQWYQDIEYPGIFNKVSCDFQYTPEDGYESFLDIFFGFIRVKENSEDINLVWKFNSIFVYSTISGEEKTFGCNSFRDSDLEILSPYLGRSKDGTWDFMKTADKGDDISIAKVLGLKPCKHNGIFELCNDAQRGIFI